MYNQIRSSFDTRKAPKKKHSKLSKLILVGTLAISGITFGLANSLNSLNDDIDKYVSETKNDIISTNLQQNINEDFISNHDLELFGLDENQTSMYGIPIQNNERIENFNIIPRPDVIKGFNTDISQLLTFDEDFLETIDDVFNTIMIDIKETDGLVSIDFSNNLFYTSNNPVFSQEQITQKLELLAQYDFYRVARICTFKDDFLARENPNNAILDNSGELYTSRDNMAWLDIYNKNNWREISDLAESIAYNFPFEEINFDYIRAPATYSENVVFPSQSEFMSSLENKLDKETSQNNSLAINAFADFAVLNLAKYGVNVSFDLFGAAIIHEDQDYYSQTLGQDYVELAKKGYIYGMFYPSHYSDSEFLSKDWLSRVAQITYWSYEDAQRILTQNNFPHSRLGGFIEDIFRRDGTKQELRASQLELSWNLVTNHFTSDCFIWSANLNYLENTFIPNIINNKNSTNNYLEYVQSSPRAWNSNYY